VGTLYPGQRLFDVAKFTTLTPLSPLEHGVSLGCRGKILPPDMEGRCDYWISSHRQPVSGSSPA